MQQNPLYQQLLNFLTEFMQRLRTKKPKFFVYMQYGVLLMGSATGLPSLIAQFSQVTGIPIVLGPHWTIFENKFIAACSLGFWFASQLTTASKVTATKDGDVLKATDASKLPFTASLECKKAEVSGVPEVKETR